MANLSQPPQYTIGKMVIGGVEVEGHDITVGENATVEIDATLMAGVVSVEGVVKKKDGKPVSGAMVALVPRGMEARTHFERISMGSERSGWDVYGGTNFAGEIHVDRGGRCVGDLRG